MKKNAFYFPLTPLAEKSPLDQNAPLLQQSLECTEQDNPARCFARFGHILAITEQSATEGGGVQQDPNRVQVNFEGNLLGQGVSAQLGRAFRRNEIELAISSHLTCRIEFIHGDVNVPVVTDIFFSLLSAHDEVILRAERITIEASKELIVRSGETQTRYSGRDKRITTTAKYVTSQAEKAQKIQGGTVSIN